MSAYSIPKFAQEGLQNLMSFSEENLKKIIDIIEGARVGEDVIYLLEKHKEEFEDITEMQLGRSLTALFSMVRIYSDSKSSDQFISDFANSYKEQAKNGHEDYLKLQELLKRILPHFAPIKATAKAKSLYLESERVFMEARIISDVRIVYNDNEDQSLRDKNQQAILTHNLRITYQKNQEDQDVFITLTHHDLLQMKDIVDRAIKKDKSIKTSSHELTFIDLKMR